MADTLELLYLFSELSIGLLGFAGVAAAFGGRSREFGDAEYARLLSVFTIGGPALAVSFTGIACLHAGINVADAVSIMGVTGLAIGLVVAYFGTGDVFRLTRDKLATTERSAAFVASPTPMFLSNPNRMHSLAAAGVSLIAVRT